MEVNIESTRVHVIVTTHTTRHLAGVLAGLSRQSSMPDTITVTCDTDDESIEKVLQDWRLRLTPAPVYWVRRAHGGEARPAQTRNNGVRALLEYGELKSADLLLFLDGDIVMSDCAVGQHRGLVEQGFEVINGFREFVTEAGTAAFDAERYYADGEAPPTESFSQKLTAACEFRARRNLLLRKIPYAQKPERPTLIGCHHAVTVRTFARVNGYDELYDGYAGEDDDFSRRINRLRPFVRFTNQHSQIQVWHLHHPTRRPDDRKKQPAYIRFQRDEEPVFAVSGFVTPREQSSTKTTLFPVSDVAREETSRTA